MTAMTAPHRSSARLRAPALVLVMFAIPALLAAQDPAPLAITSPADGSVFAPGQTLVVTVTSPTGAAFTSVGVSADDPIGPVDVAASLPAQFSATIPTTARCGKYTLTALAATESGENAVVSIEIDVERPDLPGGVFARLPEIVFEAEDQTSPLTVLAGFTDGSILDVTRSTNITYASSDPAVATVDATGVVTAIGPGFAQVTAAYGPPEANLVTIVAVLVPDPPFAVSPHSLDFGTHSVGTSSSLDMTVTNSTDEPLAIAEVSATGDYVAAGTCVASSPLAIGATCTVSVSFAPTEAGPREGVVAITNVVTSVGLRLTGIGAAPPVTISGFTPDAGPVGTSVTIDGTGFGDLPSQNAVTFGGTAASVTSASATSLVVSVPPGATSGPIALSTPNGAATSAASFTVTGPPLPTITGFTPGIGVVGTVVTITGVSFDLVPAANQTRFNVTSAKPTASTATTVTVPVPTKAGSGHITVTTPAGTAVSSDDFIVPPAPYGPADVAVSSRIPFAIATTVTVPPNQIALMLFDGTAGQRISVVGTEGMTGQSDRCDVSVSILRPNNTVLAAATCMETSGFINTRTLPTTGTYTILVDPADSATGSITLQLHDVPADVSASITPGGPAVTVTTVAPGQNAVLTFAGTAGQRVSLRGTDGMAGQVAGCDVKVNIRNPDDSVLAGTCMEIDGFIDVQALPSTGLYTIVVNPRRQATGSTTLALYDVPADTTGAVTVAGPAVAVSPGTPGQNGLLAFSGTSGAQVTVRLTGNTVGRVTVRLLAPDETELASKTSAAASFKLAAQTLPATGTYTIVVDPTGPNTGAVNVNVTSP